MKYKTKIFLFFLKKTVKLLVKTQKICYDYFV